MLYLAIVILAMVGVIRRGIRRQTKLLEVDEFIDWVTMI